MAEDAAGEAYWGYAPDGWMDIDVRPDQDFEMDGEQLPKEFDTNVQLAVDVALIGELSEGASLPALHAKMSSMDGCQFFIETDGTRTLVEVGFDESAQCLTLDSAILAQLLPEEGPKKFRLVMEGKRHVGPKTKGMTTICNKATGWTGLAFNPYYGAFKSFGFFLADGQQNDLTAPAHTRVNLPGWSQHGLKTVAAGQPVEEGIFESDTPTAPNITTFGVGKFKVLEVDSGGLAVRMYCPDCDDASQFGFGMRSLERAAEVARSLFGPCSLPNVQHATMVFPSGQGALEGRAATLTTTGQMRLLPTASDRGVEIAFAVSGHELAGHSGPGGRILGEHIGHLGRHEGPAKLADYARLLPVYGSGYLIEDHVQKLLPLRVRGKLTHAILRPELAGQGSEAFDAMDSTVSYQASAGAHMLMERVLSIVTGDDAVYAANWARLTEEQSGNVSDEVYFKYLCNGLEAADIQAIYEWFTDAALPTLSISEVSDGRVQITQTGTTTPRILPLDLVCLDAEGNVLTGMEPVIMRDKSLNIDVPSGTVQVLYANNVYPFNVDLHPSLDQEKATVLSGDVDVIARWEAARRVWGKAFFQIYSGGAADQEFAVLAEIARLGAEQIGDPRVLANMIKPPTLLELQASLGADFSLAGAAQALMTLESSFATFASEQLQGALNAYNAKDSRIDLDENYDPVAAQVGPRALARACLSLCAQDVSFDPAPIFAASAAEDTLPTDLDAANEAITKIGDVNAVLAAFQAALTEGKRRIKDVNDPILLKKTIRNISKLAHVPAEKMRALIVDALSVLDGMEKAEGLFYAVHGQPDNIRVLADETVQDMLVDVICEQIAEHPDGPELAYLAYVAGYFSKPFMLAKNASAADRERATMVLGRFRAAVEAMPAADVRTNTLAKLDGVLAQLDSADAAPEPAQA